MPHACNIQYYFLVTHLCYKILLILYVLLFQTRRLKWSRRPKEHLHQQRIVQRRTSSPKVIVYYFYILSMTTFCCLSSAMVVATAFSISLQSPYIASMRNSHMAYPREVQKSWSWCFEGGSDGSFAEALRLRHQLRVSLLKRYRLNS